MRSPVIDKFIINMINLLKIDPLSLKLFVLAIELGSITAAAQEAGLSIAAASKRLTDLEAYLDVSLLVRGKKGVVPTHAGTSLHQHALEIMARIEQLVVSMRNFESGAVGQLRIALNASSLSGFISEILSTYRENNPGVVIDIEEMLSEEAVRAVEMGMVDLAIVGDNTFIGSLECFQCDEDEFLLLTPENHPLASNKEVDFQEALSYEFVALPRSSSLSRLIRLQAELINIDWKIRVQVRSFDSVCNMVEIGMGLAIVPSKIIKNTRLKNIRTKKIIGLNINRRLIVIHRDGNKISYAAKAFINECHCKSI
jgi:DNA-binding transcriptional LysR family regulator